MLIIMVFKIVIYYFYWVFSLFTSQIIFIYFILILFFMYMIDVQYVNWHHNIDESEEYKLITFP